MGSNNDISLKALAKINLGLDVYEPHRIFEFLHPFPKLRKGMLFPLS